MASLVRGERTVYSYWQPFRDKSVEVVALFMKGLEPEDSESGYMILQYDLKNQTACQEEIDALEGEGL